MYRALQQCFPSIITINDMKTLYCLKSPGKWLFFQFLLENLMSEITGLDHHSVQVIFWGLWDYGLNPQVLHFLKLKKKIIYNF